nr:MBL fold metallo-hydrolase [Desulfobacterales bacterium]
MLDHWHNGFIRYLRTSSTEGPKIRSVGFFPLTKSKPRWNSTQGIKLRISARGFSNGINADKGEAGMLIKQMLVGVMDVFCYIIGCEITKRAILIDPAGDEEHVVNTAADLGYTIEAVVNTHGHPDHTCGNEQIVKLTRAKIMIHEADWQYLDAYGVSLQWGFRSSPPADVLLRDGDIVEFGNERLTVLHTPGHTPGSICLYGDKNLFTGDTLFVEAVGRT